MVSVEVSPFCTTEIVTGNGLAPSTTFPRKETVLWLSRALTTSGKTTSPVVGIESSADCTPSANCNSQSNGWPGVTAFGAQEIDPRSVLAPLAGDSLTLSGVILEPEGWNTRSTQ